MKDLKYLIRFMPFVALLTVACEPDTSSSPEPEDVFVKLYGSEEQEVGAELLVNDDGTMVLFGSTNSPLYTQNAINQVDPILPDADFFLIFTDSQGNAVNEIAYDDGRDGEQVARHIIRRANGGYVMVGSTTISEPIGYSAAERLDLERGLIIVVDANGDEVNTFITTESDLNVDLSEAEQDAETNRFRTTDFYTRESKAAGLTDLEPVVESINSVIETSDGNLIIIGTTNDVNTNKPDFDTETDLTDIWVVKFSFDNFAQPIFERRIGFPNSDGGIDIFERPDGSLVMIANGPGKDDTDGNNDVLYVSSDASVFNNNFSEFSSVGGDDIVGDVSLLSDGGVAVTGTTDGTSAFMLRINSGGSQVFFNRVQDLATSEDDPLSEEHEGLGITEMNNGGLAVVGVAKSITGDNNSVKGDELLFFNTDAFGNLLPEDEGRIVRLFGGGQDDEGTAVIQLPDGRFVILGTIDFENDTKMISLMKTSSRGDLIR